MPHPKIASTNVFMQPSALMFRT